MANDEYRKALKTKHSELAQFKRESDQLTKMQSLKIKELEFSLNQDQKRLSKLQKENDGLLKQLTEEKTRNVAIDDELQRKEEHLEDLKEAHESQLKSKVKEVSNMEEEITIFKRRLHESSQKLKQANQKQNQDKKAQEVELRKKTEEWNDIKLKKERLVQKAQLKRQQCLEFIDLIRKEEKNIVPQIDAKIKHYFNAAF